MDKGIYFDGVSAETINCEVVLSDFKIYIYFKGQNRELLIWDTNALESCLFYGANLKIIKEKVPGQRLEVTGTIAKSIFDAYSHPKVEPPVGRPKKVISFFILCLLAVISLGVLCYVYLIPWVAGKAVSLVPEELEIKLGESLSSVYLKEDQLEDSASFFANKFVGSLQLDTKYPIHLYVLKSNEINAFAVPGGNVFVYSGLIKKMDSYEELVALIGHEATHVIKRHSLKSIMSSAASGLIISSIFGDFNAISLWVVSKADEFKQLNYSRDLETEADKNALRLMAKNNVSGRGMLQLLEVLKKESAATPAMMKYLSTHPETDERISAVGSDPASKSVFHENIKLKNDFLKIKSSL
jgi:beta-barrel assembly-enhancing protease